MSAALPCQTGPSPYLQGCASLSLYGHIKNIYDNKTMERKNFLWLKMLILRVKSDNGSSVQQEWKAFYWVLCFYSVQVLTLANWYCSLQTPQISYTVLNNTLNWKFRLRGQHSCFAQAKYQADSNFPWYFSDSPYKCQEYTHWAMT